MKNVLVTGAGGLIGSAACLFYLKKGCKVIGIDNDMRAYFFNTSVQQCIDKLVKYKNYIHFQTDIRDSLKITDIFANNPIDAIIHTAAQPSHDWAAKEPATDFTINANGTLNLLEASRQYCADAPFVFTSTNKVYGDTPNKIELVETATRYSPKDPTFTIDETMSIDNCTHSLFGVSKCAADLLVQEYGRYFNMPTVSFRGGCLTGPNHQGAELHGFLSYLVKCTVTGKKYTVYGHKGKQVRDNIHCDDLISAFDCFIQKPRCGEVYNIGGGKYANISMIEAIEKIEELTGKKLNYNITNKSRIGDHIWYVSNLEKFMSHYPEWTQPRAIDDTIIDMVNNVS